jgi:hypothetical protein
MTNSYGPEYEKQRKEERKLERELLLLLRAINKPVESKTLHLQFDSHELADIGHVLNTLKEGRYIAVDEKNNVTITKLGLKRLEAGMF